MSAPIYAINEVFYSLQGEGARAGTANVFVRFAACNLRCSVEPGERSPGGFDCDTEFTSGRPMTGDEVLLEAVRLVGTVRADTGVIFTGGEPAMQLDQDLVKAFKERGFFTAIETNGTYDVDALGLDWITLSPKVATHAIRVRRPDEVKYVRGRGQGIPQGWPGAYQYISPAACGDVIDREALAWCIDLVKANPQWRLSVQQHKFWRVR